MCTRLRIVHESNRRAKCTIYAIHRCCSFDPLCGSFNRRKQQGVGGPSHRDSLQDFNKAHYSKRVLGDNSHTHTHTYKVTFVERCMCTTLTTTCITSRLCLTTTYRSTTSNSRLFHAYASRKISSRRFQRLKLARQLNYYYFYWLGSKSDNRLITQH